jgi:hypothetical protein
VWLADDATVAIPRTEPRSLNGSRIDSGFPSFFLMNPVAAGEVTGSESD